jgi:murein DD-endopeptidase MepM/ murein hydrolase activator NlpD
MSDQTNHRRNSLRMLVVLCAALAHGAPAQGQQGLRISPPFSGTYRLTAYFDHYFPNYAADPDGRVTVYTGEQVANCSPYCYRGHSGYDWSMPAGTPVRAAADGVVEGVVESSTGYGNRVVIRHDNGHRTIYTHLREHRPAQGAPAFNVVVSQSVRAGDVIGWSGNTGNSSGAHLHFGVYRGPCLLNDGRIYERNATDPFGWNGSAPDPLLNYPSAGQGHTAACLWRSHDEDPLSCDDVIVEDASAGSIVAGRWLTSTRGNGYHMFYTYTLTSSDPVSAGWTTPALSAGLYRVYAYVPSQYATARQARYSIWTASGWQDAQINQLIYSDVWVSLGEYALPVGQGQVVLRANTGESPARWIAADAVKFRRLGPLQSSYAAYLPIALNAYCPSDHGQLVVNSDFSTGEATGWLTERSNGHEAIVQRYNETNYGAWLGRYDDNQDRLSQPVASCADARLSLSFWWWMNSEEAENADARDYLHVRLRSASGELLQTILTLSNRSQREQWEQATFDLSAYAGQALVLSFEAINDAAQPSHFWIDNVSLVAGR